MLLLFVFVDVDVGDVNIGDIWLSIPGRFILFDIILMLSIYCLLINCQYQTNLLNKIIK